MSSVVWFWIIVAGATAFALGNIKYPLAREAEKKRATVSTTVSLLQPELEANLELVKRTKRLLSEDPPQVALQSFNTAAWETVSSSELLLGLDSEKLSRLMRAYHLVKQANHIHGWIEENTLGISSVVKGEARGKNKEALVKGLSENLDKLEPLLLTAIQDVQSEEE